MNIFNIIGIVIGVIFAIFLLLIAYSCCVASSSASKYEEYLYNRELFTKGDDTNESNNK